MPVSNVAGTFLIVFVIFFGIITVALLGAIAFALIKFTKLLNKATESLVPTVDKVSNLIDTIQRVTMTVGDRADQILSKGESITDSVADNVEKTSKVFRSAVTAPLINLSSVLTGITAAISSFGGKRSSDTNYDKNGHKS